MHCSISADVDEDDDDGGADDDDDYDAHMIKRRKITLALYNDISGVR